MIEKTFDKMYPLTVPQGTLTRVANRMLKEYKQAFDGCGYAIPDDITKICTAIKNGETVDDYEDEYSNTLGCGEHNDRMYDEVKLVTEERIKVYYDEDEYGEPMYHISWYFYASVYYEKRIGTKKVGSSDYATLCRKVHAAKGKYRYFCTHRPPDPSCVPHGYVSRETYLAGSEHIGEVTYDEQPPKDELTRWGLVLDTEWERIRACYAEEG